MDRRRQRRAILTAFLLLPAAGGGTTALGQSVRLAARFEPQRESYLEFSQHVEQTLSGGKLGAATAKTRVAQMFGLVQNVEAAGPQGARVLLTIDRVAQRIESDAVLNVTYDSARPAAEQSDELLGAVYRPMVGMPLTMDVGPDGTIRAFSGMKPILERVRASAAGNVMFERMKTMLCDEVGQSMWGDSVLVMFPNRSVNVGETWTRTLEQPNPLTGPLLLNYEFRLAGVAQSGGRELAEVTFRGDIRPAADARGPLDCTVCYEFERGAFEGTATIDLERGACIRQVETGDVTLKMTVPDAARSEPVRMTLVQKTKLEFRSVPLGQRQQLIDEPPHAFSTKP